MRSVVAIVDLQFGSTGKGQIAGMIGRLWEADTAVCANGPNAGHTYRWTETSPRKADEKPEDKRVSLVRTVLPVTAILPTVRNILLGPGAVINLSRLATEIEGSFGMLSGKNLIIHPNTTVVMAHHVEAEGALVDIGSTMKGTAEAVIEKMRRRSDAPVAKYVSTQVHEIIGPAAGRAGLNFTISSASYDMAVDSSDKMLVEGAQGSSLSIHSDFYPHTTSRDVSLSQIWADCRLPTTPAACRVIGVCRTFPIRVANRYNTEGQRIGFSGGCYDDQREIKWEEIGREPELTTVTKLPRRLFTFSTQQIIEACRYNTPNHIALTFCDYLSRDPGLQVKAGEGFNSDVASLIRRIEAATDRRVDFLGYGPHDTDLFGRKGISDPVLTPFRLPWGD